MFDRFKKRFMEELRSPGPLTAGQEFFANIVGLLIAAIVSVVLIGLIDRFFISPSKAPDLPERIQRLTGSLNAAAKSISEIESEIQQRQELVRKLVQDAEIASKLSTLNKEQVDAVSQVLSGQIKKQGDEGFWKSQLYAFGYTVLGVVLAEFYRAIQRRRRSSIKQ